MPESRPGVESPDAQVWTTRRLLAWTGQALAAKGVDEARLASEILLGHVLGVKRLSLFTDPDRPASREELATLRGLMARALKHEPVQYLTGRAHFFGLELAADQRALIPRPCTEMIVERVLQEVRAVARARGAIAGNAPGEAAVGVAAGIDDNAGPASSAEQHHKTELVVADMCTGSGCIALALAKHLKGAARIYATDVSVEALGLARENARALGLVDRVELCEGDLLAALPESLAGRVDYLVANPPYIPDHEWDDVPDNVKLHEPTLALRGGTDGLALVGPLVRQAPHWLAPGGVLMVEIAACTSAAVLELARATPGLHAAEIIKDHEGLDRVLVATRDR
jgi:release factor glutamine methyltransferase